MRPGEGETGRRRTEMGYLSRVPESVPGTPGDLEGLGEERFGPSGAGPGGGGTEGRAGPRSPSPRARAGPRATRGAEEPRGGAHGTGGAGRLEEEEERGLCRGNWTPRPC